MKFDLFILKFEFLSINADDEVTRFLKNRVHTSLYHLEDSL